ncbi:UNKNOWN [Stylonychia lemnae]|uniref:Uncharacterized protein n=1 Tax=Stylonychia lemnae TaxID=5949 RepID=A0A078BBK6_STYLE|nr:UNKNOWN [Stylonychia lemnae]|eukprot:CDW91779.1 UNKNOWN [Stylonychia lemnae]
MERLKKKICCQLFSDFNGNQYLLPLKSQIVNARIMNSIATIEIIQKFFNDTAQPLEVTLNVPIEEDYGIGKLMIQIDEKVIEGRILEKQKAQEKYEDAVAQGHTAVMAQEDDQKDEIIKLTIGNLLPGQEATLHLQLLNILKIEGAAYCLRVPLHYFPNYSSVQNQYSYQFFVEIHSDSPVTYLSYPNNSKLIKTTSDENLLHIKIEKAQDNVLCLENDLVVYYRTNDMESTVLYSQESDSHPDQVAVMVSFVPSFIESTVESPSLETFEEEMPDPQDEPRSGSMSGGKMTTTVEALKLFLKSLPPRSSFEIISFGSEYKVFSDSTTGLDYNDQSMDSAIRTVSQFSANMGGTEIYKPLEFAIQSITTKLQKRIFMLTDGAVENRQRVIELAEKCPFDIRIHSIGVGRDCDVKLVQEVARKGRGSCSLVLENKDLKTIVIQALGRAKDPSYSNFKLYLAPQASICVNNMKHDFTNTTGIELFRNEIFLMLSIVSKKDFSKLKLKASSDIHPVSNKGINHEWTKANFKQLDKGEELFKIAARMKINELSNPISRYDSIDIKSIQEKSLKYQVLSKHTSFLAINKNDEKPVGELRQVQLQNQIQQLYELEEKSQMFCQSSSKGFAVKKKSSQPSLLGMIGSGIKGLFNIGSSKQSAPTSNQRSFNVGSAPKSSSFQMNIRGSAPIEKSAQIQSQSTNYKAKGKRMKKMAAAIKEQSEDEEEHGSFQGFGFSSIAHSQENFESMKRSKLFDQEEEKEMPKMAMMKREMMPPPTMSSINPPPLQIPTIGIMPPGAPPQRQMMQSNIPPQIQKSSMMRQSKTYDDLIMDQTSLGFWKNITIIQTFIEEDILSDQALISEIKQLIKDQDAFEQVWITLVALYILQKKFNSKKNEWELLAQKGKDYIRSFGLQKPDNYVKKINYKVL